MEKYDHFSPFNLYCRNDGHLHQKIVPGRPCKYSPKCVGIQYLADLSGRVYLRHVCLYFEKVRECGSGNINRARILVTVISI